MTFSLRRCIDQDLDQVLKVERGSFTHTYNRAIFHYYLHDPFTQFIVAEQDDQIIGYIIYTVRGRRCMLISIAVLPGLRERGIGTKLLDHVLQDLSYRVEEIELQVSVKNKRAVKFYEEAGFQVKGVIYQYYSDNEDALVMSRKL